MPAIHVLHVDSTARTLARLHVHPLMREPGLPGKVAIRHGTIADQQHIGGKNRPQTTIQLRHCHLAPAGMKVERLAAAVACDEQAIVLPADAAPRRHTAAPSRS